MELGLRDVNDNRPMWDQEGFLTHVPEDAVVGVNTLMELLALRDEGICVSVLNPPLYEGGWKHVDGLYPPEIEAALKAIPSSRGGGPNGDRRRTLMEALSLARFTLAGRQRRRPSTCARSAT